MPPAQLARDCARGCGVDSDGGQQHLHRPPTRCSKRQRCQGDRKEDNVVRVRQVVLVRLPARGDQPSGRGLRRGADRKLGSIVGRSACGKDEPGYASQETVYNDLGKDLLDHAFEGFNTCIIACKCPRLAQWRRPLRTANSLPPPPSPADGQTGSGSSIAAF